MGALPLVSEGSEEPSIEDSAPRVPVNDFVGVGDNPDAISDVRRTHEGSWYAIPLRVIPARGQFKKDALVALRAEVRDVLHDQVRGSMKPKKPDDLPPETSSVPIDISRAPARSRDVAARERSAVDIGLGGFGPDLADVLVDGDPGPVFREDEAPKGVSLREERRAEPDLTGRKVPSTDPREKRADSLDHPGGDDGRWARRQPRPEPWRTPAARRAP